MLLFLSRLCSNPKNLHNTLHLMEPLACVKHEGFSWKSDRTKVLKRESISLLCDELPGPKLRMKMILLFVGAGFHLRTIPELWKTQKERNNLKYRSTQSSATVCSSWLGIGFGFIYLIMEWVSYINAQEGVLRTSLCLNWWQL